MADERPNVVVQYVSKSDVAPPPSIAEILVSIVGLVFLSLVFGWWK